ncbi:phospholipase A1 member A-like [Leguminivora glycinivorella]|uniref:phospholipase A1 member A-like n=1 Tax=Leguminivora glycinivorella TaxID=1035111 RepID=UPI00200C75AA|nr:phospholipase A1 member A-like [Leguminivora glycinivorella]
MKHCNLVNISYIIVGSLVFVSAVEFNRTAEGHHQGLLAECPGSEKPVSISRRNLERLRIAVIGPGIWPFNWYTAYNYYHVRNIIKNPEIDFKNKKTFMYVGGYGEYMMTSLGRILGSMYKEMGYNGLVLDTFEFTERYYPEATRVMRGVGKHTGEMLAQLTKQGLNPKNLTLLGLSLGGETISFIAKSYQQITGQNISFLIALDPAGPCYRKLGSKYRLDPSDADFVLSITTNMDGFGMNIPVGTATFYVNGGEYQPGHFPLIPCGVPCSHLWSLILWLSALYNPGIFVGIKCDSVDQARNGMCYNNTPMITNTMDMGIDKTKPGIYYLPTTSGLPYGVGMKGLKKWMKDKARLEELRSAFRKP